MPVLDVQAWDDSLLLPVMAGIGMLVSKHFKKITTNEKTLEKCIYDDLGGS